jgi:hypothetical protein
MSQRSGELLLKAIRALPADEQDELLATLLAAAVAPPLPAHPTDPGLWTRLDLLRHSQPLGQLPGGVGPEHGLRVLPVRLPAGDYERLRGWSKEHDFSMAVIIRTLVERFLDSQATTRRGAPGADP